MGRSGKCLWCVSVKILGGEWTERGNACWVENGRMDGAGKEMHVGCVKIWEHGRSGKCMWLLWEIWANGRSGKLLWWVENGEKDRMGRTENAWWCVKFGRMDGSGKCMWLCEIGRRTERGNVCGVLTRRRNVLRRRIHFPSISTMLYKECFRVFGISVLIIQRLDYA
ncbi:hypothetical protein HNY73_008250 [Argiope bruennichi]|uniref:Uncharacterized protein n=1 Tax=Argiope bruennichi TaxID=94029 RepID=A0A8T0FC92_ARGBR|nr:hypothetical protein HNY73_008250 [Argiope bruennichi]